MPVDVLVHLVVCFFWVFVGACQCFVKSESPNLHRHQKNKKNKPLDAPNLHRHKKKQKKLKFPGNMGPLLSSCWIFFSGACRCLVHLVVWFFCFFGACQCFVKSESPNLHRHQKKQTTRCTKPAQAPKKTKKNNKPLDAPNLHRHQKKQKN